MQNGPFTLALLLAALAGWVDAVGIASSEQFFPSFMSGNTTHFAISIAHQDWRRVAILAPVLALFVAGATVGDLLEPFGSRFGRSLILGLEAVVLAFTAALYWQELGLPIAMAALRPYPLVFAMGLQNATMQRTGGISIGVTYVTGIVVQVGKAIAAIIRRDGGYRRLADYTARWISLMVGALLGALALSISPLVALSIAAGVAISLAAASAVVRSAHG